MPNFNHSRILCLVTCTAAMFHAIGCRQSTPPPGLASPSTAPDCRIVHPQRLALKRIVELPGMIQAYEETQLFARIPGYVRLFYDKEGRIIHDIGRSIRGPRTDDSINGKNEPGEVLAELFVPDLEQRANLKKALVLQAQADLQQAQKFVLVAEANIETMDAAVAEAKAAKDFWEMESKRFTRLAKTGTIDDQSRDETLNQLKAANARLLAHEASVRKAQADRDKAKASVQSAAAHVEVAKADLAEVNALLEFARIRAPFDGVVTMLKTKTGALVQPSGGQGDWLFTVARTDPVRVVIAVPEMDAELVTNKSEVKVFVQAIAEPHLHGIVARTTWSLDTGSRTLRTEIDLPNKDGRLRPGMFVQAQIINPLPEKWTLPISSVVKQGEATVCFLLEQGKAVSTLVKVGRSDGQFVQVLQRQRSASPPIWEEFTGNENVIQTASGLVDGQEVSLPSSSR